MIDRLVLRCRFRDILNFNIRSLNIPMEGYLERDGNLSMVRHPWERIPSSFAPIAFKVHDYSTFSINKEPDAYIELKASPAKVAQGHNIWGTDNLAEAVLTLTEVFFLHYPNIADELDFSSWEVVEADITYHSRAESTLHATQFITALGNVSRGQTKSRAGYATTAYFGSKGSRIKKIKIYEKFTEVMEYVKKLLLQKDGELLAAPYTDRLIDYCKGLIRWEVTLKKRWFERRGISTKLIDLVRVWDSKKYWMESTEELRATLKGNEMKIHNDDEIEKKLKDKFFAITKKGNRSYTKALRAFSTFRSIKNHGWEETLRVMPSSTFWDHITMLQGIGISLIVLQNLHKKSAIVIPMIRYITVDFDEQIPHWANVA